VAEQQGKAAEVQQGLDMRQKALKAEVQQGLDMKQEDLKAEVQQAEQVVATRVGYLEKSLEDANTSHDSTNLKASPCC